jgi:zinc-ribbon domain
MTRCPKCSEENSDNATFCSRCSQTPLFRCPMCWHEQRHRRKCSSCGLGMAMYWKRQFAIAHADEVEQTHELSPDLTPDPTP